jgi:cell division protein FtsZ
VKLVRNASTGLIDDSAMANVAMSPSVGHMGLRAGRAHEAASGPSTALGDLPSDQSYLDIPAFLRRQAD